MPNQVRVGVGVTGAKGAASELDRLRDKFSGLQKQGAKGLVIGAGVAATNLAFSALQTVVGGVGDAIQNTTDAFIEDEKSQGMLRASLKANIVGWDGNTQAIERVLASRTKLGFSDEEQRDSLSKLAAATGDVKGALDIQSTAMDLARFKNISLAEATDALTKIEGGSFRILKSLGIELPKNATQTQALAAVQKVAAGEALAYTETLDGKLTVAQVQARESTEKLGAETAKLSVAWNEMWLHALNPTTVSLKEMADAAGGGSQSAAAKMRVLTQVAADAGITIDQAWEFAGQGVALNATAMKIAVDGATDSVSGHGDALIGLRQAAKDAASASGDLAGSLDDTASAADTARQKVKDVNRVIDYLAGVAGTATDELAKMDEALFGGAERAGNVAQAKQDLADLLSSEPNKHTRAWTIWNGKVAEAKQRIFDLTYEMKKQEGPQALDDWLRRSRDALKKTDRKAIDFYNTLIAINSLNLKGDVLQLSRILSGRYAGKSLGPDGSRAAGGPVSAGKSYLVGEQGPEVIVPSSNGTVIPNGAAASGTGAITINLTVAAPSGTDGRRWGQDVADSIAGSLRQQSARLPVGAGA